MRVAIANDAPLATEALRRVILSDPNHEIAWTAADGDEAVRFCRRDLPDVILMDLLMPVMNGAEATRRIMEEVPCPILVVTATLAGNYTLVCEALGHGAYDAVCTPELGDRPPQEAGAELLAKLAAVRKIQRRLQSAGRLAPTAPVKPVAADGPRPTAQLVAIGASAGGPNALRRILSQWPAGLPALPIIVQHIGKEFVPCMAQWLGDHCRLSVAIAAAGDRPQRGVVLVADADRHLVMTREQTLTYTAEPQDNPYRPSVDVFFESLARHWPWPATAVLLTGIGRDGAEGLLKLRRAGWHTIAQDESTSAVFGMPQAAQDLDAAVQILPVDQIASEIAHRVQRSPSPPP